MYKKILNLFLEIKENARFNIKPTDQVYRTFNYDAVVFDGIKSVNIFNENIDAILNSDKEISGTLSKETVIKEVIQMIYDSYNNKIEISEKGIFDFWVNLKSKEIIEFEILRKMDNVKLDSSEPYVLGPFTFYNLECHMGAIYNRYPEIKSEIEKYAITINSDVWVSVKVSARDIKKSRYLADLQFNKLENILRYMIGDISGKNNIGILDFKGAEIKRTLILSHKIFSNANNLIGPINIVDIRDDFFINQNGNKRIWDILKQNNASDLEHKILNSIEWTGKGLNEMDNSKAFIQFFFAIEALLTYNDGDMISPSIANSISETISFILCDKLKDRLEMEKIIKNLYKKRSAIVHGRASANLQESDLITTYHIANSLVVILLNSSEYKCFKSNKELHEWVKEKKYS